jgi:hypothetical protein
VSYDFGISDSTVFSSFGSTQIPDRILTPAILKSAKKRTYAPYQSERTPDIWNCRSSLLEYKQSLTLQQSVDAILDGAVTDAQLDSICASLDGLSPAGVTQASAASTRGERTTRSTRGKRKEPVHSVIQLTENSKPSKSKDKKALAIRKIIDVLFPIWQKMAKAAEDQPARRPGIERFESGKHHTSRGLNVG